MSKNTQVKSPGTKSEAELEREAYAKKRNLTRNIWLVISGLATVSMVGFAFSGMGSLATGPKMNLGSGGSAESSVIGTVNGVPLRQDDFKRIVDNVSQGQSVPVQEVPMMRSFVLDQMISGALLESQASKYNVTVSDSDIQAERTKAIAQAGLAKTLSLSPTATQAEIDNALTSNGSPSTEVMFPSDSIKSHLLQQKVKAAIDAQTVVTEDQARASFTEYHTAHILIGNKTRSDAQAQLTAQKITTLALAPGADFAALAKKYSEDPGTKNRGGDDDWIGQGTQYVPEFKTAAFALKAGEITKTPVASPQFGYFIIKCIATRNTSLPKDFDKNKAMYIAQVQQKMAQDKFTAYITALKNDPSIKINITDPRLAADRALSAVPSAANPGAANADYATALSNYLTALKDTSLSIVDKGAIDAAVASIYEAQKDTKNELTYLVKASDETKDPGLTMQLGQMELKNNDTEGAITAFKSASAVAWNDASLHYRLMSIYKTMNRPDLVQAESQWIETYNQQQKAAQANQPGGAMGGPGGLPPGVSVMPSSGGQPGSQPIIINSDGGGKPNVHLVPSSGAPASPPAKSAQ